jgi:hypothetical protein
LSTQEIYKSTLVSQLNGNPFLSKDRLIRVKNSINFINSEDYLRAANCANTQLLRLGSDCAVFFVHRISTTQTSAVKAAEKCKRKQARKFGCATSVQNGGDKGTWWLGRVQKMRRNGNAKWHACRQPIDILNHPSASSRVEGLTQMVLLNWFSKASGNLKFKYDHSDSKWIDVDSVIATVTLSYLPES